MKHANSLRITATSQQLEEFERRCQLTELMLAGTLCGRFGIEKTNENLELVAGWMQTARSLGVVNQADCGIRLEMGDSPYLAWAVERWRAEVGSRPLDNVHRRTLDDTWRQVIRQFVRDPVTLVGPPHDELAKPN